MGKFIRRGLVIAVALSLTGCNSGRDTANRTGRTEDQSAAHSGRIVTLETRIEALEGEVRRLASEQSKDISMLRDITAADAKDGRAWDAELKRLSDNDQAIHAQIDYLRALQGKPAMPEVK